MSSQEKGWRTAWLRGGSISEVTWIGRDVIGWCAGLHLVFLDVSANRLRLPDFDNEAIAAGSSCLSGHLRHRVFAFAEKNLKPRIHVYAYPSLTKISTCNKGTSFAYLATAFAGDFLVSLGSMSRFRLCIWSWRTGEKITSVHSPIHDSLEYGQVLRVNYTQPLFIAQVGNKSGRLLSWETIISSSMAIMKKTEILLPQKALVKDVAWCPDSSDLLAIADRDGHIYLCNSVGECLRRIVLSQRCAVCVDIEAAAICWYRGGIVLRTTFCQIRYYRKDKNEFWRKMWYQKVDTHPCALISHPLKNDRVFFFTAEGHVVQMNFSDDLSEPAKFDVKQFIGRKYLFIDFLHPYEDYIVAIEESMELVVLKADIGVQISTVKMEVKGKVMYMLSHPEYPLVVASSDYGEVIFVSFIDFLHPKIIAKYWMQVEALDLLKFSTTGRYLVVCQKNKGLCYFFDVSCMKPINILTELNVTTNIADVVLFDTSNSLKFCALQSLPFITNLGCKLRVYDCPSGRAEFSTTVKTFCLTNFYQKLHYVPGQLNAFVGSPYLTKKLSYFKISDGKNIHCYNVTFTEHYASQIKIFMNEQWLVTTGSDGLIIIATNLVTKKIKNMHIVSHHWRDSGTSQVIINLSGDLLIALGADGSLVAIKYHVLENLSLSEDKYKNLSEFNHSNFDNSEISITKYNVTFNEEIINTLHQSVENLTDLNQSYTIPWNVLKKEEKMKEEIQFYLEQKNMVLINLTTLKNKIMNLLNENETYAEYRKLPLSVFALNKVFRERKMKSAKDEREETRHKLEFDILQMNRISSWLRDKFWNLQKVLGQSIFGIFNDIEVTNYGICEDTLAVSDFFSFSQFMRNVVTELTSEDDIYPWTTYTTTELNSNFEKQLRIKKSNIADTIDKLFDEEESQIEIEIKHDKNLYEGMTTYRFIEPCAPYYSQFKIYAFSQFLCDNLNITEDTKRLRLYFNKHFNDMVVVKEREMNLVCDCIDRILFVISELKMLFNERVTATLTYPEWHLKEKPESIVTVLDSELTTKPYVSPSYQEILDKQAAEEERAKLARQADNFHERALESMMDGVMEVRWEDIIKRDPLKPECLIVGKSVDDYTDEDKQAIKKYKEEVKWIETEREKYYRILQTDYKKINDMLAESIDKFNSRLEEFHLLKIKVEAAIQQLNLRYVRYIAKHVHRLNELKEVDSIKMKIQSKYQELLAITEEIKIVEDAKKELHSYYEDLLSKDKLIEKKFQSEFPKLKKNAFGAILQQYKRRPRIALKNTSAAEGMDLVESITSMNRLPYLTSESIDYLRQLDHLDIRPTTLPHSIEQVHWENLIVLRRLKIGHELKQRAVELDLNAAANILTNYIHKQSELQTWIDSTCEKLRLQRFERIERDLNIELQLVLKMGQVEDEPLRGNLATDLQKAIAIPGHDVEAVNQAILSAGRKKLRAIRRSLQFDRGTKLQEWEYRCLNTKVEHRAAMLYHLRLVNVTREMKEYLKKKKTGRTDDKTMQRLQRDFDKTRNNQEKIVKEWKTKLIDLGQEVYRITKKNHKLDKQIIKLNVERCELELKRNFELEARQKEFKDTVVELLAEKSAIVRNLLENYEEILKMRRELNKICGQGERKGFARINLHDEE